MPSPQSLTVLGPGDASFSCPQQPPCRVAKLPPTLAWLPQQSRCYPVAHLPPTVAWQLAWQLVGRLAGPSDRVRCFPSPGLLPTVANQRAACRFSHAPGLLGPLAAASPAQPALAEPRIRPDFRLRLPRPRHATPWSSCSRRGQTARKRGEGAPRVWAAGMRCYARLGAGPGLTVADGTGVGDGGLGGGGLDGR